MQKVKSRKTKKNPNRGPLASLLNIGLGKDRDYFLENLSTLVGSGMSVVAALSAVNTDISTKRVKKFIEEIKADIESGIPFWRALHSTGLFSDHTISLLRIGEESGRLPQNLMLVSEQLEKDREFKSRIRSAMLYPVFVMGLTVVIGISISWFILPKLAVVFSQLKLKLPLVTRMLIGTGTFFSEHGLIAVPAVLLAMAIFFYVIFVLPRTKIIGQTILFHIPGIRKLIKEVELARFGYLLGTLLKAGLPVSQALKSLSEASVFPHYKKFYVYLTGSIEEGNSFQRSFLSYRKLNKIVPSPIQQLIVAGEQSGNLPETLIKVSQHYETKTETTTKNLTIILEPILLVFVWLGVLGVAIAVILPIYNLVGGLNNDPNEGQPTSQNESVEPDEPPILIPPDTSALPTLVIDATNAGYINVRNSPSSTGLVVNRASSGESYKYSSESSGWYQIILPDNTTGWVSSELVNPEADAPAEP